MVAHDYASKSQPLFLATDCPQGLWHSSVNTADMASRCPGWLLPPKKRATISSKEAWAV